MSNTSRVLTMWNTLSTKPGGRWAFSRAVCLKAPYFGSIRPHLDALAPEHARVSIRKRRAVQNHIGTVHAIAMCNMAEFAGGLMTEVTLPTTHRWIPKGMTVEYLKKAATDLSAVASPDGALDLATASDYRVRVEVYDKHETVVFRALITMWVTPKDRAAA
ncbi:hotdog fold domain-containing protein [Salinisphaera aquimarina]|uniref:Hotdog fold domain-containing protein n=1 Tax=Salinisphaera aquimarina TaxID=2094031 RepID=A0ABV7EK74_9GAMM